MDEGAIEALETEIQKIKYEMQLLATDQPGTCADLSMAIKERLIDLGYKTGRGKTMLYSKRSGNDYIGRTIQLSQLWWTKKSL